MGNIKGPILGISHNFSIINKSSLTSSIMYLSPLSFQLYRSEVKNILQIPFADFLNHDGVSETVLLSDEGKQISEVAFLFYHIM